MKNAPFRLSVALLLLVASLQSGAMPTLQAAAPACEVTGNWSSSWGDMELTQTGSSVTGTYTWDAGTIEGSLSGSILTGKWREAPSYSEPNDAGDIVFTFAADCASMTGKWRYGSSGTWYQDWSGTKLQGEYGVIERDGKLFLISPPDGPLVISTSDLPAWARAQMATVDAVIANVGPPDAVATGDPMVILDGKPVARLGDSTVHGGTIVEGSSTIFVNGVPAAFRGCYTVCPLLGGSGLIPHVGGPIVWNCDLELFGGPGVGTPEARIRCMDAWVSQMMRDAGVPPDWKVSGDMDDFCAKLERDAWVPGPGASIASFALSELCHPSVRFRLESPASQGSQVLQMDGEGLEIGDTLVIGSDPALSETARVAGKGSVILDHPLENSYPAGTQITRVPNQVLALVPPPLAGPPPAASFSPDLVPGVNLTTYSGGTVAQLTSDAASFGATSIAVSSQGNLIVLVVGAPTFVNVAFEAHFTDGVPPAAVMIILVS